MSPPRRLAAAALALLAALVVGVVVRDRGRAAEHAAAAVRAAAAALRAALAPVAGAGAGVAGARCGLAHTDPRVLSALRSTGGIADGAAAAFGVRSSRVVFAGAPGGDFVEAPATVVVAGGRVLKVVAGGEDDWARDGASREVAHVLDFGALVVMPGFVDVHVHVKEPDSTEKEGFRTATMAAAAGGVSTIVDMPLQGVQSTITAARLSEKLALAEGRTYVDVAYWAGFVADNTDNATVVDEVLRPLLASGVAGAKAFLNKAGFGFNLVSRAQIEAGVGAMADTGLPLLVHSELDLPDDEVPEIVSTGDPFKFATFAATKPRQTERRAIEMLLDIWATERPASRLHIVHIADSESLPLVADAKRAGMNLTVETCPQYLYFSEDEVPDGSTAHKCKPPIRTAADRDALWRAVIDGDIDMIASDHAPYSPPEKAGNFLEASAGITLLQLDLPSTWTAGAPRGLTLERMAEVWARQPAALAGLAGRKGSIEAGMDADFLVFDPREEFVVDGEEFKLFHRHNAHVPFMNERLTGRVRATFVRGEIVFLDGEHSGPRACGKSLLRHRDF